MDLKGQGSFAETILTHLNGEDRVIEIGRNLARDPIDARE